METVWCNLLPCNLVFIPSMVQTQSIKACCVYRRVDQYRVQIAWTNLDMSLSLVGCSREISDCFVPC